MSPVQMPVEADYTPTLNRPVKSLTPEQLFADAFTPAIKRAAAQRLVAYLNEDGSYGVPSHSHPGVEHRVYWPEGATLLRQAVCSCEGYRATCCTHRAVAIAAKKEHVHVRRPATPAIAPLVQIEERRTAREQVLAAGRAENERLLAAGVNPLAELFI